MLPFAYAIRNLFRDRSRLVQTIGGTALVVWLVMAATAFHGGMNQLLSASGSPHNVILLGAGSEESIQRSEVPERTAGIAESSIPGIARPLGVPAVSTEIHYMTYLETADGRRGQALFRGVTARALLVHPEVQVTEGAFPRAGEVMLGSLAWKALGLAPDALRVGSPVRLDGAEMTVSGRFTAPGTVMESEIWCVLSDLRTLAQRETVSCVTLRMEDERDFAEADLFSKQRLDLELTALRENEYYAHLAAFFRPIRVMVWVTVGLVAAGAVFGGLNTLYAAFASRIRELATLQAIGFSRGAILFSLMQESVLASLIGTLLASLAALWLFDGRTISFSIGAFPLTVTPAVAASGLVTGILMGMLGALAPAIRCLRPPVPVALRGA